MTTDMAQRSGIQGEQEEKKGGDERHRSGGRTDTQEKVPAARCMMPRRKCGWTLTELCGAVQPETGAHGPGLGTALFLLALSVARILAMLMHSALGPNSDSVIAVFASCQSTKKEWGEGRTCPTCIFLITDRREKHGCTTSVGLA